MSLLRAMVYRPYRITLYRNALSGRQRMVAYRTVAHAFQHVVQIRRDRLPCMPPEDARARYEQEAEAAADRLVPACGGAGVRLSFPGR